MCQVITLRNVIHSSVITSYSLNTYSFAEILFGLSETDGQLELREKHYEKIKRKSLYWIAFLVILLAGHAAAFFVMLE